MAAVVWASWSCCIHSQRVEINDAGTQLPLFIQFRTLVVGVLPPTFRVSLPISINPVLNFPHRHAPWLLFWVILDPIQLTILTSTLS